MLGRARRLLHLFVMQAVWRHNVDRLNVVVLRELVPFVVAIDGIGRRTILTQDSTSLVLVAGHDGGKPAKLAGSEGRQDRVKAEPTEADDGKADSTFRRKRREFRCGPTLRCSDERRASFGRFLSGQSRAGHVNSTGQ